VNGNTLVYFYTVLPLAGAILSMIVLFLKAGDKAKLRRAGINGLGKLFASKEIWEERGRVVKLLAFVCVGVLVLLRRSAPETYHWAGAAIGLLFMLIETVMVIGSVMSLWYRVAIRGYERPLDSKTRKTDKGM
jgi:hypothetical protein